MSPQAEVTVVQPTQLALASIASTKKKKKKIKKMGKTCCVID